MKQFGQSLRAELAWAAGRIPWAALVLAALWVPCVWGADWRWAETAACAALWVLGLVRARRCGHAAAGAVCALVISLAASAVCVGLWALANRWADTRNLFQWVYAARGYTVHGLSAFLSLVWTGSVFLFSQALGAVLALVWARRRAAVLIAAALAAGLAAADVALGAGVLRGAGFWLLYGDAGFCPWCGVRSFALGAAALFLAAWLLTRPHRRDTICIKAKQR